MKTKAYEKQLRKLQAQLAEMQEWVKSTGHRAIIVFEGRDTAGKGGTIRALTGIQLIKLWLEVGQDEQTRRMSARIDDPLRQWKLSPMDVESWPRRYDYSRARATACSRPRTRSTPPGTSDDKKRARLNCLAHILKAVPWKRIPREKVKLPKRSEKHRYDGQARLEGRRFVPERY